MLNTERLMAEKELEHIEEQREYKQDKITRIQNEMDGIMKEIKKIKE